MTAHRRAGKKSYAAAIRAAGRPIAAIVLIIVVLEAIGRLAGIRPDLLPTPSRVLLELSRDGGSMGWSAWATASELLGGILLALSVAVPMAMVGGLAPGFARPALLVLRSACSMPLPAVAPIALVWFGYGRMPKVLVAAFLGTIWVARRWLEGMSALPVAGTEIIRSMGAGDFQLLWYVKLPATVPALMSGLRAGTSNALIGIVIGEFVAGDTGLGPVVISAMFRMNTPQLAAALGILLALGLLSQLALKSLETFAVRRTRSTRTA